MKFCSSFRSGSRVEGTVSNRNSCFCRSEAGKDGSWAHIHLRPSVKHLNLAEHVAAVPISSEFVM